MTTPPQRTAVPEWQLWAYQIKSELQGTIHAVDKLLKEFQTKITSMNDGFHANIEEVNDGLTFKISEINKRLLEFSQVKEDFEGSKTTLANQEQQVGALQEELATEQSVSTKRHKQQNEVNRNTREDMLGAAEHLAILQRQAKLDSERKDSEIEQLKTDNAAIWQKVKEMEAALMQPNVVKPSTHIDLSGKLCQTTMVGKGPLILRRRS